MNVLGLYWLGTQTDRFDEVTVFYERVMGL